jgi:hypothetical protein
VTQCSGPKIKRTRNHSKHCNFVLVSESDFNSQSKCTFPFQRIWQVFEEPKGRREKAAWDYFTVNTPMADPTTSNNSRWSFLLSVYVLESPFILTVGERGMNETNRTEMEITKNKNP